MSSSGCCFQCRVAVTKNNVSFSISMRATCRRPLRYQSFNAGDLAAMWKIALRFVKYDFHTYPREEYQIFPSTSRKRCTLPKCTEILVKPVAFSVLAAFGVRCGDLHEVFIYFTSFGVSAGGCRVPQAGSLPMPRSRRKYSSSIPEPP